MSRASRDWQSSARTSSASDYSISKRIAQENEKSQRQHYEAQMRSEGVDPRTNMSTAPPSSSGLGAIHAGIKSGNGSTVAGFLLGAFVFINVRTYLSGGLPAVKAWYSAKFFNKTASAPNPIPASAQAAPSSPSTSPAAPSSPSTPAKPSSSTSTPTATLV